MRKLFHTKVQCRACKHEIEVKFEAPPHFDPIILPKECEQCGSELSVHVKRGLFKKQLLTKVNMVKVSEKFIDSLKDGPKHAEDYA